ncbi:MAG: hypothetical protein BGO55_10680 [Sphingobacteriales bacterium 50-39]|nr:hypothetical protein [Sphingobacteriales bacterium]OJW54171.1 MAG: hypothetical protein BGO55_10680 [Sphingobacteriales bacterium 50-39]
MQKLLFTGIWISLVLLANAHAPGDNSPDIRAIRNFVRIYKDASDAKWQSLHDGGYVCRFMQSGVMKRAIYDEKGRWLTTIAGYTAEHLPADVRRQVHSVYYDYSILYVNEINVPGKPVAYVVQVQDQRTIRVVRVVEGEMEEIREIETL